MLDETAYSPGPLLFWLLALPVRIGGQSLPGVVAGLVNVASIMGIVALAHRRGGRPFMLATAIAIPLVLLSLPGETYSDACLDYVLRWTSPVGMAVWLMLGFALVRLATTTPAGRSLRERAAQRPRTLALAAAAGLAVAALTGAGVAVARNPPREEPYEPMRTIIERLEAELPADRPTYVAAGGGRAGFELAYQFEVGVVYWLRRAGREVVTAPSVADRLTSSYAEGDFRQEVRINVDAPPAPGRELARIRFRDPLVELDRVRTVRVTVRPAARVG